MPKAKEEKKEFNLDVFRHSTAHLFAHAVAELYPNAKPTIGPSVEEGFYYDFADLPITPADFPKIEKKMQEIAAKNYKFEKSELSPAEAKKMFKNNKFKLEMIDEFLKAGDKLTAYKDGDFIDLCKGPHVASTGEIKAFKLTKLAGAYWRGNAENEQLTRVYGISFPTEKELRQYLVLLAEAEKRDHRKIGKERELFMIHELALPGSPFFLPAGTIVYDELLNFIRAEYKKRGYQEVITPLLYKKKLWETSGHWEHYKDSMFTMKLGNEEYSLKPMNCPSHCLIYQNKTISYKELPLRIADFAPLHRNELAGVLGGLTRVTKMSQDDAHIFCMPEQVNEEITNLLEFAKMIYTTFKFEFAAKVSTRPEKFLGEKKQWDSAESALKSALEKNKIKFEIDAGAGAFYGPKIDFFVKDALGRLWQLSTIQLDFQMPQRFGLTYEGQDNTKHTPVMIHRAILGSLERFIGVLIENYAGRFPLWLSPEQARILTVSDKSDKWAEEVEKKLKDAGLRVGFERKPETIGKKIRDAQLAQVNYILVIGEKEQANKTVNVRPRSGEVLGELKVEKLLEKLLKEIAEKK
jgi:threonyl-tRNA synthetase